MPRLALGVGDGASAHGGVVRKPDARNRQQRWPTEPPLTIAFAVSRRDAFKGKRRPDPPTARDPCAARATAAPSFRRPEPSRQRTRPASAARTSTSSRKESPAQVSRQRSLSRKATSFAVGGVLLSRRDLVFENSPSANLNDRQLLDDCRLHRRRKTAFMPSTCPNPAGAVSTLAPVGASDKGTAA